MAARRIGQGMAGGRVRPAATGVAGPRRVYLGVVAAASATLLTACGHGTPAAHVTVTVTPPAQSSSSGSAQPAAAVPPSIVAVTSGGALVTLNPATGTASQTLVPHNVIGDEISVSGSGMVYFAIRHGCSSEVEAIPSTGGAAEVIAAGSLPAISPDGTKLALAREPSLSTGCVPSTQDLVPLYSLVVRTLSTGAEQSYPMVPAGQGSGLPAPISHLSWAADSRRIAVSVSSVQDNEGWNLVIVDTSAARYYLTGSGTIDVPVTGQPSQAQSYLREGVFMPDGNLFISRACCGGMPVRNTSRLMWEVTTAGALVHQVAIGFANLDHTSLDVSSDGHWLLYLGGNALYVSDDGARPSELTSGLTAAAWG
jgi:hypothetical protein